MQSETFFTTDIDGFSHETITLPGIQMGYVFDDTQRSRPQDSVSIVELGKQLLRSAKDGDTEAVRDLMCRGAPFQTDCLGTSALHAAAQYNHLETADVLLRAGISRDARTKVDRTPLHMAAYEGHPQMAILLLNYGADVDSKDMLKMTPLHWAVEREHEEVMHVLLEHGANANAISKFGKTPISLALEHDRLDLVDMMQQEREVINVQQQQQQQQQQLNQASSVEFDDTTTYSFMQIDSDRQMEQQPQFEFHEVEQKQKLAPVQAMKKPKLVFQKIHTSHISDDEQDKDAELADRISNITHSTFTKQKDISGLGLDPSFRFLQGLKVISDDNDSSIVGNAMESGRTVILTEAGKLALNLTGTNQLGVKRLQVGTRRGVGKKIIKIARADQFLNESTPSLTSRGPNILKRNSCDNKPGKIYLASIGNNSTSVASVNTTSPKKHVTESMKKEKPVILPSEEDIEEITDGVTSNEESMEQVTDIAMLNKQLFEARRLADEYRKKLLKKEEEAEIYKQQLKNITAQKTAK